jgi:hypothetical protein
MTDSCSTTLTALPVGDKLAALGFTENYDNWIFVTGVSSAENLKVVIAKEAYSGKYPDTLHHYSALVVGDFNHVAAFGQLPDDARNAVATKVSEVLSDLREAGLTVELNPRKHGWDDWSEEHRIRGVAGELDHTAEANAEKLATATIKEEAVK